MHCDESTSSQFTEQSWKVEFFHSGMFVYTYFYIKDAYLNII